MDCTKRDYRLNRFRLFASVLTESGFEDADIITALTLALVFATVLAHGLSISWLAKKLNLQCTDEMG